ncbi:uncharacterized protein si:ch73-226l13.2 [Engraulis encrasicolus]|uniref:uncharacterized protein si:ch73-226l13.2 n=1 Tax=Engraulis encrasicolus TaxID=184585 RepID=UPI002FCFE09C
MVGVTVSVLRGRGSTHNESGVGLVSDSAEVTQVTNFRKDKEEINKSIENFMYRGAFLGYDKETPDLTKMTENVTIYYYDEQNDNDKETNHNGTDSGYMGLPVVLNFTATSKFLKCSGTQTDVTLRVEECDKEDLKDIYHGTELMSYLFYMKAKASTERTFESARFKGWFVHTVSPDKVNATQTQAPDDTLCFLIRSI